MHIKEINKYVVYIYTREVVKRRHYISAYRVHVKLPHLSPRYNILFFLYRFMCCRGNRYKDAYILSVWRYS